MNKTREFVKVLKRDSVIKECAHPTLGRESTHSESRLTLRLVTMDPGTHIAPIPASTHEEQATEESQNLCCHPNVWTPVLSRLHGPAQACGSLTPTVLYHHELPKVSSHVSV